MSYLKPSNSPSSDSGSLTQDLRNVARVCRFFCSVALPWIFESFRLVIGRDETGPGPENRTKFCRHLLNGEQAAETVAHFVKKCTVSFSRNAEIGWALQELLAMYFKAISHMPNIEEIVLSHIIINKNALKSLARLERLKTLRIMYCHLAQDVKENHLAKISTLRLSSLDILFPPHVDLLMDQSNDSNHRLAAFLQQINWSCITQLVATEITPTIEVSPKSLPLVKLDLRWIEMAPLLHLLARTPSLRVLRVAKVSYPQQTPLDSSTAPMLEELEAPLSVCTMLVPGRPVANLSLANVAWQGTLGLTEASIFRTGSCPISQFRVPLQFYLDVPFWKHFPSLRVLRLDVITANRDSTVMFNAPIQEVAWSSFLRKRLSLIPFL